MDQVKWMQDQNNIYIQYYVGKSKKSSIEITVYENFFQVYDKSKKNLNRIDFYGKVKLQEFTAFSLNNNWIKFQVQKQEVGLWEQFNVDQEKNVIKQKRQEAIRQRDLFLQNLVKKKKEQKHKEIQKGQEQKFKQEDDYQQQKNDIKQQQKQKAFNNIENIQQNVNSQKILLEQDKNKFLQKFEDKQKYQIRNTNEVTLEFTPKVYNNLAMREQYIFQPPQIKDSKKGGNFMWLHDKGNEFLKKKDYESALNAYKEALKIEPSYLHSIANMSLIHLKLTEFSQSYQLCEKFENLYLNSDENTQNLKQNKIMFQQITKRKVFILLNQGKINEASLILQNIKFKDDDNIKKDLQKIEQRMKINKQKQLADRLIQKKQYQKAQVIYQQILKEDSQNEKVLSNLSLIEMKNQNFKQALIYINQTLEKISIYGSQFEIKNKNESSLKDFIEKQLMRKINCEEQLQMFDQMNNSIQFLLKINLENQYAIQKRKYLQIINNKKIYDEKKIEFKKLVTQKKFDQALELFNQMEKLITLEHDTLEFLTLSLNKSVIYSYQKKFSQVIAECSKGLRIITNLKKNSINQKRKIFYQKNKQDVQNIEIKYLFKRANAYLQTKQLIGGKQDLECVLQYDPMNKLAHQSLKKVQEVCQLIY